MTTGEKGIALIKRFEGYRDKAYLCPAGKWTIGYGHTRGVHEGMTCTEEDAGKWLRSDLHSAECAVNKLAAEVRLNQNQFDALVSFVFNLGEKNFANSTLRRKIQAYPANPTIRDEFRKWIHGGGRILPGLVVRREAEAELYFSEP